MQMIHEGLEHLIVVPGHAVYVGHRGDHVGNRVWWQGCCDRYGESDEVQLYAQHIEFGVRETSRDDLALLVFSGGQTRTAAGPRSEALGYWLVAEQLEWFGERSVKGRATTEEYARDSCENLLFGIYRFHQHVGSYPTSVKVCGFGFKKERFRMHRAAIAERCEIPDFSFQYLDVNDPPDYVLEGKHGALEGERRAREEFRRSPRGEGDLLEKRSSRDPFRRGNPYRIEPQARP